jgi:tRNA dimethylallyltransferase
MPLWKTVRTKKIINFKEKMEKKIPLLIIAGPTGSGKSYLAMELAQKLKTDIISADSRQIYRDFDIGTAKPPVEEQKLVRHHLIDIRPPTENFTVAEYAGLVKPLIEQIHSSGKLPLLVGGTGLYIKSLIEGFSIPEVKPLPELRRKLNEEAEQYGNNVLYERARSIDPTAMEKIHENDLIRIIRVLEVFESTGQQFSSLKKRSPELIYNLIYIGLDMDREKLYERIGRRVEKMIEDGLVDEVKSLMDNYGSDLNLLQTINYREIRDFILEKSSLDEAKELMKKDTRNFAKRQLTWFRNDQYIRWEKFENEKDVNRIIDNLMQEIELL